MGKKNWSALLPCALASGLIPCYDLYNNRNIVFQAFLRQWTYRGSPASSQLLTLHLLFFFPKLRFNFFRYDSKKPRPLLHTCCITALTPNPVNVWTACFLGRRMQHARITQRLGTLHDKYFVWVTVGVRGTLSSLLPLCRSRIQHRQS